MSAPASDATTPMVTVTDHLLSAPGEEVRKTSSVTAHPPRLDSVLTCVGSNRAFAIFVQEQVNASQARDSVGLPMAPGSGFSSNAFVAGAELHNNGVPGMMIGCGKAGCIDVEFYGEVWKWQQTLKKEFEEAKPTRGSTIGPQSSGEQKQMKTTATKDALDIFTRYLLNPTLPSATSNATTTHPPKFPPLHVPVTTEQRDAIQSQIESSQQNQRPLPSNLFQPIASAVYTYLNDTYFGTFLNTLAFDHLEVESLLLGTESKKFLRSAHNVYKEEYVLFYFDYENFRQKIEVGPESDDSAPTTPSLQPVLSPGSSSLALTGGSGAGGRGSGSAAENGVNGSLPIKKTASMIWFDEMITALDSMVRTYFRAKAEYAIYIESDIRLALTDALKLCKRTGKIEMILLNTLLTIKDYTVEVMKYDVLPTYESDARIGHRRQRRASLIAADPVAQKQASNAQDSVMAIPVLQLPLPPPQVSPEDPSRISLSADRPVAPRRQSIITANVDVPLGARRSSTTARGSISLSFANRGRGASSSLNNAAPTPLVTSIDGEMVKSSADGVDGRPASDSLDDGDGPGVGPSPSSNPNLRSFSDLRARRSIIGGSINPITPEAIAAVAAAAAKGRNGTAETSKQSDASDGAASEPESDDNDDDEEDEKEDSSTTPRPSPFTGKVPSKTLNAEQFKAFTAAAAKLQPKGPPPPPPPSAKTPSSPSDSASSSRPPPPLPPATSSSSPTSPANNTGLALSSIRRRSVIAPGPPPPAPSSLSTSSSSSAPGLYSDKEVSFSLTPQYESLPSSSSSSSISPLHKSHSSTPPKSILKTKIRSETMEELLKRIFEERCCSSDLLLPTLKAGCLILKYNAAGKAAERWFKVSQDGTELCWGKVDEKTKTPLKAGIFNRKKKFPLADVTRIRYGSSNSKRFSKYNLSAKSMPWMAWSIYFPEKTLDLVCRSEKEMNIWFQGLQALVPLSTSYLSRAGLIWKRIQMKIKYYSMWQNIETSMFVDDLLSAARSDISTGRLLPATPVVDLLNTQIAATPDDTSQGNKKK